ncbi:MAG: hypothetical protein JWO03_3121, partial [Bacteroidetes bacterium]|nr:hypothetical protein [Bacteroidota bacterium]
FGDLNVNDLGSFFLHNATVTITRDGDTNTTEPLNEICLRDFTAIPDSVKRGLLYALGVDFYDSSTVPNICVYTLSLDELAEYFNNNPCIGCGQEGHRYDLKIKVNGKTITSYTTIPHALALNGLGIRAVPGNDSLVNVTASISVPSTSGNFIRYWTRRNSEPYYTAFSGSVYDDKLFSGQTLTLPVERGIPGYVTNPDPVTYGYFWKGDTVTVKWTNIDSRTFDFYNTLENDGGGSPFSSPVRVKSNVSGDSAIGIWAGYGARYYTITIPR